MNFSISKESFSHLLYLTNTIVEKKTTMPILAHVNFSAADGKLKVYATDLEISFVGEADAEITTPGSITVSAKVIHDVIKELPEDEINVQVGKNQRLEVESGQARFKINGVSSDEFPTVVGTELKGAVTVDATKLYEMLDKTAYSVSTDETRYNINGVFLETINTPIRNDKVTLRMVATDGHRLSYIDRPAEGLSVAENVIIPRKGIQEIKKVLEGNDGVASVSINEGFFTVQSKNVTLGVRLIDGQYPDYRQVIPVATSTTIDLSRSDFLSAVRRVSLVTTDRSKTVKFKLVAGNLVVSSSSPEYGEATESLAVNQTGDDVTIGFSARYLLDLLNAMPHAETVQIRLNGELGPGVIVGSDDDLYTCIVMPMRFE